MSQPKTIALLTDFGLQDVYVGVMKGVIAKINPQIPIIDLTHQISPQDLFAGRFALLNAYKYFPPDTVHIAVIDPGVGSHRRGIAIQFSGGFLVGADNGLFSGVLSQESAIAIVELNNSQYWRTKHPSTTFHGRDIFASVGAHLANGVKIKELGTEISQDSLVKLSLPQVTIDKQKIIGCVQYIDVFGNLITNIANSLLKPEQKIIIKQENIPWGITYSDANQGELIAFVGSHKYLEIAVNCGNAKKRLQLEVGEAVLIIKNNN